MAQGVVETLFGDVAAAEQRKRELSRNILIGGSSGALDTMLGIPNIATTVGADVDILEKARRAAGLTGSRPEGGVARMAYDFGEGAVPGAMIGGAVGGPVGAAAGGLFSGVANYAGKQLFPEQPSLQMALNFIAGLSPKQAVDAIRNLARSTGLAPEVIAAKVGKTGVTLTPGQVTGDIKQLEAEAKVTGTAYGANKARQVYASNQKIVDEYANSIQSLEGKNLSAETIRNETINAFNKHAKTVRTNLLRENKQNFDTARKAVGDAEVVDTTPVVNKLQGLIDTYGQPGQPAELQAAAAKLQKVLSDISVPATAGKAPVVNTLTNEVITPGVSATEASTRNISVATLQNNLESWGRASYGDSTKKVANALDGLSPGTQTYISKQVLSAYREALDGAIQSGVGGADALAKARDVYKVNLKTLEDMAVTPWFKKFGIDSIEAITPTNATNALKNAKPAERQILIDVLGQRPDVLNSLRSRAFEDVITKSNGDFGKLRSGVDAILSDTKNTARDGVSDLEWLFPTKESQVKLKTLFEDLYKLDRAPLPLSAEAQAAKGLEGTLAEGTGALGGAQARYQAGTGYRIVDFIRSDPKLLADAYFDPNFGKQGKTLNVIQNTLGMQQQSAMQSARTATIGAGALTAKDVNAPEEQTQLVIPPELEEDVPLVIPEDLQGSVDFESMIRAEAEKQGVPQYADQLIAMARAESSMNPNATAKGSSASGLFQLTSAAQKDMKVVDPFDPAQNISGGVGYYKQQLDKFGSPQAAMAAYNQGPAAFASQGFTPAAVDYINLVQKNM